MAILGIDEVGRGPFAGPLVLGAVVFPKEEERPSWYVDLKDSKQLSERKREELAERIKKYATVGLGFVSAGEIDKIGMLAALKLGTRRAVKEVQRKRGSFSEIIIDGNLNFLEGTALGPFTTTLIKGDDLIKEISAASIVAKCVRDDYMRKIAEVYPEYGFESHVGYGTDKHRAAIKKYGLCPEHRRFIKCLRPFAEEAGEDLSGIFCDKQKKNTTKIGSLGEATTVEYLEGLGHVVVMKNFKTKLCEIDVISIHEDKIYFTEVKYRKNSDFGGGLAAINAAKLEQMKFAAECFIKFNVWAKQYEPILAAADVDAAGVKDWLVIH